MNPTIRSRIAGIGSHVPARIVTNEELTEFMDTSNEWIVERTGIRERRWVDPDTTTSDLALESTRAALEDADMAASDLDMIILATLSPDHQFPGTACFLQAKLGLPGIPALDVRQQCCGFIYALAIADQFIRSGTYRKILVVGAEVHSKGLDLSTRGRDVSVLFGDGAGAVVLDAVEVGEPDVDSHVFSCHIHADGAYAKELWLAAPGMAYAAGFVDEAAFARGEHYPQMNGRAVFVHAVKHMAEAVEEALAANDTRIEDVELFFFHQANRRISEGVAARLQVDGDRVVHTIDRFGNTTAASIPLGLDSAVRAGKLKPGQLIACAAFGSGFTWASTLLRW